ncbi:prolyl oligopeptidase family serine peptidase [Aliidiomarina sp. Khilg15.8]
MKKLTASLVIAHLLIACSSVEKPVETVEEDTGIAYPAAERSEQQTDYHGTLVADPYRWLEATQSAPTQRWISEQNQLSGPLLDQLESHAEFKHRLTKLWNYERTSAPFRRGDRYFQFRNDGLQDHSVLQVSSSKNGVTRTLLDPNQLSADGTLSLGRVDVSPGAKYLAYGVSEAGSDWTELRIRDVASGRDLDDRLTGLKYTPVAWLPDESGFYYSRYPETAAGEADGQEPVIIYFHRLGTSQSNDRRILDLSQYGTWNPYPAVSNDGRFLIATVRDGFDANAIYLLDLTNNEARWQPLMNEWDGQYRYIDSDANLLFFHTTQGAPRGRVIAVDVNRPHPDEWEELIAEREHKLEQVNYVGGKFFATYLRDAQAEVHVFNAYGRHEHQLDVPANGSVSEFTGTDSHLETFFTFTSFTQPGITYHYDIAKQSLREYQRTEAPIDNDRYTTRQVFYHSADGTRVPMFVTHRDDISLNGNNPTLLTAYGGFGESRTPDYSASHMAWLEQGGVLAVASVRGGGEYGEDWHASGRGSAKQHAIDDFIAAAEYLIEEDYTQPSQLGIQGSGHGALLVGAAITQRPQLFAAALPTLGVFDMLRYQHSNANAYNWRSEFGLSSDPDEFATLLAYSPLHNVEAGRCYPATLLSTGANNDRVKPWHTYKFTAALQHAQGCDDPILLQVGTRAAHSPDSPTWMRIEQVADQWAFLYHSLREESLQSEAD